jgi:ribosomal protein S27E
VAHSGGNVNNGDNAGFAALPCFNMNNSSENRIFKPLTPKMEKYMILTKTVKYRGKDKLVSELNPNSNYKVDVQCPQCGDVRNVFYKSILKAGHYACHKCSVQNASRKLLQLGQTYNRLTVIGHSDNSGYSKVRCECGKEKEVGNYELTSGKTKSCGCIQKETNVTPKFYGDEHPNWKGGISSERELHASRKAHKEWKEDVLNRDEYTCLKCKSNNDLCVHHIVPFEESQDMRCDIDNGATLCRKCHNEFHSIYGRKGNNLEQLNSYIHKKD